MPFFYTIFNLPFMAQIALMARTMVAAARIVVDHPRFNQHSSLSKDEVRANYAERWFMEAGGTLLQHAAMYGAMQGISRWFERCLEKPYHYVLKNLEAFPQGVQDAFVKHFGQGGAAHPTRGLIHRATFNGDSFRPFKTTAQKGVGGSLQAFFESARPHLSAQGAHTVAALEKTLQPFSGKLLRRIAATPLIGVVAGCVTGGILIQLFNDRIFRPLVKEWQTGRKTTLSTSAPSTLPQQNQNGSTTPPAYGPAAGLNNSAVLAQFQRFAARPNGLTSESLGGKALW